jgi:putative ABC transport system substrate-binding protein
MPHRRALVGLLLASLAGRPFHASAQRPPTPRRIALLVASDVPTEAPFHEALRERGYVDGGTVTIDRRSAGGDFARLPALAAELVAARPDVLVAFVTQASLAAKQATSTIPIVMVAVGDPVASGLVADLRRPGGNVTGTAGQTSAVVGKQLELIRDLAPGATRIATLWNPGNPTFQAQSVREAQAAAVRLGMRIDLVEARTPEAAEQRLKALASQRPDAVLVLADPLFITHAGRIAQALLAARLVGVGGARVYAEAGLLATYAPDLRPAARSAARYVDLILRGSRPGDLPVEIVSKFDTVVNVRTAEALGIAVPASVLARAEVVP